MDIDELLEAADSILRATKKVDQGNLSDSKKETINSIQKSLNEILESDTDKLNSWVVAASIDDHISEIYTTYPEYPQLVEQAIIHQDGVRAVFRASDDYESADDDNNDQ